MKPDPETEGRDTVIMCSELAYMYYVYYFLFQMRNITIRLNVPNNSFVYHTYYEKQAINIKNMILRPSMDFNYIDKVITYACTCGWKVSFHISFDGRSMTDISLDNVTSQHVVQYKERYVW